MTPTSEEIERLRLELYSNDPEVLFWAAAHAGNYGAAGAPLLPRLFEMMSEELSDSHWKHWGEFTSAGRILFAIDGLVKQGKANDELKRIFDESVDHVLCLLKLATGASASMLVRILVMVGPTVAWAAEDVLSATLREVDPRMKYRAFQFALAAQPALLQELPWSTFAPVDTEVRIDWERAAFDP